MTDAPLADAAIDALLARIRAVESVTVTEDLELYPDTRSDRSELRARPGGTLEHATFFAELAPGHGWSVEQREVRALDEAEARALLRPAGPRG